MSSISLVMSDPVPPGAPLLLAPRLVDAFGFRQTDFTVEDGEIVAEITARNSGQQGYLIRPTLSPRRPILHYGLEACTDEPPCWIWNVPESHYMTPSLEFTGFMTELVAGSGTEAEAIQRIVAHVSEVFWYGHGHGSLMDGRTSVPLLRSPTRGHCVDMHGYCVAACHVVGVTAAYCAGFWFKEGSMRAPGMHCWFVAKVDGTIVHYDVSHQLKVPTRPVVAGLNPIPGIRFLAAVGKGLVFETPFGHVQTSHFAKPIWLTDNGLDHFPAHELQLDMDMKTAAPLAAHQLEPAC